jgi:hypothetical protein
VYSNSQRPRLVAFISLPWLTRRPFLYLFGLCRATFGKDGELPRLRRMAHAAQGEPNGSESSFVDDTSQSTIRQMPLQEKPVTVIGLTPCDTKDCICSDAPKWGPSILRFGPLGGLTALLFAFLQIFASYAILRPLKGMLRPTGHTSPQSILLS